MSMVIRSNINSMNANRNLSKNNGMVSKSLEKLASGYAINRAADDASGLAISEKMQAQITGLEQASKNTEDGVSLIKVAEGACNEIHDMLNRTVELATKASNGTIQDEVDREAIQAEYQVLCDEIDRISQSTNFNGIPLFEGETTKVESNTVQVENSSGIDTSKVVTVGGYTVTGGVLNVDFKYDSDNDKIVVLTDTKLIISGTGDSIEVDDSAGSANITLQDVNIVSTSTSAFSTGNNDVNITLIGNNILTGYEGVGYPDYSGCAGLNVGSNGSINISGDGYLNVTGGNGAAGIGGNYKVDVGSITITGGNITAIGGYTGTGIGTGGNRCTLNGNINITGGNIVAIGGDGSAGIGTSNLGTLNGNITITGGTINATGGNTGAGIGTGISGVINGNITLIGGNITATGGNQSAGIGTGQLGTIDGTITTNTTIISTGGWNSPNDIGNGYQGTINNNYYPDTDLSFLDNDTTTTTTTTTTITTTYANLILQVGDTNATYQKVSVPIVSMLHTAMGLDGVDLITQTSAGSSIDKIKNAINYVSEHRANLGAVQNRLEYTINNLNNTVENITSSNSKIRDTDMASEMIEYTKQGVLVQSAQSMLAQSNQAPQQILSLLG